MRLEDYNPMKNEMYQVIDPSGKAKEKDHIPDLDEEQLKYLFRTMLYTRTIDEKALSYQRQGRMLTYAPNLGQEAAQVGSAYSLDKEDWLVPAFRELGAWLVRGGPLKNIYLCWEPGW